MAGGAAPQAAGAISTEEIAGAGQQARREQFEAVEYDAGQWRGSVTVCRKRMEVTRRGLELLLDKLEELAALDAEALAIEQDFPAWRVWLSSTNRWWATWQGPKAVWTRDGRVEITVDADDLPGLRARLAAAQGAIEAAQAAAGPA
jgi:hypothetical protein